MVGSYRYVELRSKEEGQLRDIEHNAMHRKERLNFMSIVRSFSPYLCFPSNVI